MTVEEIYDFLTNSGAIFQCSPNYYEFQGLVSTYIDTANDFVIGEPYKDLPSSVNNLFLSRSLWQTIDPPSYFLAVERLIEALLPSHILDDIAWQTIFNLAPDARSMVKLFSMFQTLYPTRHPLDFYTLPPRPAHAEDLGQLLDLVATNTRRRAGSSMMAIAVMTLSAKPGTALLAILPRLSTATECLSLMLPDYTSHTDTPLEPAFVAAILEHCIKASADTLYTKIDRLIAHARPIPLLAISDTVRAMLLANCPRDMRPSLMSHIARLSPIVPSPGQLHDTTSR